MAQKLPAEVGQIKKTNAEQAEELLGVAGTPSSRAKANVDAYMARNQPADAGTPAVADDGARMQPGMGVLAPGAMVDLPKDATPEQVAAAPPAVQDLAATTGQVPKEYVDGVKQQQAGIQKQEVGAQQAQQAVAEVTAPAQQAQREVAQIPQEDPVVSELRKLDENRAKQMEELRQAKLEPSSFWSGKTGWEKVVSGIGLALASLTPQGAANAVKIIDSQIQGDIERQKFNIANKREALNAADKRYADLRATLKDDRAADLAERGFKLDAIKVDLQRQVAANQSEEAKRRLGLMEQQLDVEREKNQIALAGAMQKLRKSQQAGEIPGYAGMVSDPTEARKMREAVEAKNQIGSALQELDGITKTFGRSLSPTLRAQGDQKVQLIQLKLKELLGLGVLSEADDKRLREIIDNPTNLFGLQSTSLVQQAGLRKFVNGAVEAKAKGLGLQKITPKGLM